ncbi:MAG: MBL fold metallo-hydrolase [Bacteroidetes bacterium]|nr:MBL fold metallo-hydrolase [Bacteroidota bacterium]
MEITWMKWDSFKINIGGKIIYLDPVFGDYTEKADLVLVSHSHQDHSDLQVISKIRTPKTVVLTTQENEKKVNGIGLSPGESYTLGAIKVIACHAYNIVRMREPGVPFHPKGFGVGWIIEAGKLRIYFMGDTELIPEMSDLGSIDVLMIPISGTFVMDIPEAIEAVKVIRPKITIPMHFGVVDVVFGGTTPTRIALEVDTDTFKYPLYGITEVRVLAHGESTIVT